ncbi:MAG TPA: hypothetical protein ENG83_02625 [Nitrospirae bacterium]|nr:hypothetical protein BMS3Abin06_00342 [bacterium BMS3Abin06]GBE32174.1 hypothetical protein BMS3Bbin05_01083 [bacterium BMS3Bbin05]HDH11094.1 hypothetical protein [Nitrospirota bacterium]HDY99931.1 hypothetical protein [Nitrospirota bacterium]
MKRLAEKIIFFDKTISVLAVAVTIALIFTVMSFIYAGNMEKKNNELKTRLTGIQSLSREVIQIKTVVESKEKKISLRKSTGVVSVLEQILKSLGLEAKEIKPLKKIKVSEFTEENAELEIQDVDLNSIVNLLYKIDISPLPMKIKSAAINSTFEDPDKFILKLTVSLLSRG